MIAVRGNVQSHAYSCHRARPDLLRTKKSLFWFGFKSVVLKLWFARVFLSSFDNLESKTNAVDISSVLKNLFFCKNYIFKTFNTMLRDFSVKKHKIKI